MPIEWLPDALDRLTGDVEPYEVSQVLNGRLRRPVPVARHGVRLLTIWGRTRTGRPLVVVLRLRHGSRDAWILAARQMTAAEAQAHKAWEETRDE